MKKIIILIVILIGLIYINREETIIIPEDSIRFRIIANSNSLSDQTIKRNIKKEISNTMFKKLSSAKTKSEALQIIKESEGDINHIISQYNIDYNINLGNNYFPEKNYKGITYESGEYESFVISLGEAKGDNWWCVMYPPFCLLDENSQNKSDKEYKLYVKEILDRLK